MKPMRIEIYCHTSPSQKRYVGQSLHGMKARWRNHVRQASKGGGFLLHEAIRKYGAEAFAHELLEVVTTIDAANAAEQKWIAALKTLAPNGYNLRNGGDVRSVHEITRKRIGAKARAAAARKTPEERRSEALARMSRIPPEVRSAASKAAKIAIGPARLSEIARKTHVGRTREQEAERGRKANAKLTPEQRSERARRVNAMLTPEERSEIARARNAAFTAEQRRERQLRAAAALTPEQLSDRGRRSQAAIPPERRKAIAVTRMAARSPEDKAAALKKGWETRRAKARLRPATTEAA